MDLYGVWLLQVEQILKMLSCSGPNPNIPNFVNTNTKMYVHYNVSSFKQRSVRFTSLFSDTCIVFIRIYVVYSLLFIYVMYSHFSTDNQHPYGTSSVHLLADLFLSSYEVEFIQKRIRQDHYRSLYKARFNFTFR